MYNLRLFGIVSMNPRPLYNEYMLIKMKKYLLQASDIIESIKTTIRNLAEDFL
jgi:hypothetical protein